MVIFILVTKGSVLSLIHILQSLRLHLTFSLAVQGFIMFRLPWGTPIFSYFIIKVVFLILLGLVSKSSLVWMDELMQAVVPFCPTLGGGMTGGSNLLPGPSGPPDLALVGAAGVEQQEQDEPFVLPEEGLSPSELLASELPEKDRIDEMTRFIERRKTYVINNDHWYIARSKRN